MQIEFFEIEVALRKVKWPVICLQLITKLHIKLFIKFNEGYKYNFAPVLNKSLCRLLKFRNIWVYWILFFFLQISEKIVFFQKIALEYDLYCIIRKDGVFFPENMIFFFRRKMKDDLSQKYMIFSVYSVKMVFFSLQIWYYPSVKNAKMIFSWKSTIKDDISDIIEKDVHPRKYCISSDRKIEDDKKVYFYKKVPVVLCTFKGTFIGVYCFPMKKTRELNT